MMAKKYPLKVFEFLSHNLLEASKGLDKLVHRIVAKVVDFEDEALVEAIRRHAEEQGFTKVYLLDKTFVENALKHELERWEKENANC